jgi:Fur family transcriptional regulator, peroxide stress response regulator
MADPHARTEQLIARLREAGCRITPQRIAVVRVLAESVAHPSVEHIYERVRPTFPTTSIATVYKTVKTLKAMGEVLELEFGVTGSRYDGNRPYPHPHLVCIRCGTVVDFEFPVLEQLPAQAAQETGYRIVNHRLDLFGVCARCQEAGLSEQPPQPSARRDSDW